MKTPIFSASAALLLAANAFAGERPLGPPSEPTVWGHEPYDGSVADPSIRSEIATTRLVRKDGRWAPSGLQPDGRDPVDAHRGR